MSLAAPTVLVSPLGAEMLVKASGFTLIELAVGMAIIALLAAAGVPLTTGWIDQSRASEAAGQVRFAYAKARALALRGQDNVFMCINNGVIYLYGANPGTCGSTNPLPVWQTNLAGGTATTVQVSNGGNTATLSCFALNRKGWSVDQARIGETLCSGSDMTVISVTKGSKNVSKDLL